MLLCSRRCRRIERVALAFQSLVQGNPRYAEVFGSLGLRKSYCQIWCTEGWSCDGPAVLGDLDAVVELHALDHLAELTEAA